MDYQSMYKDLLSSFEATKLQLTQKNAEIEERNKILKKMDDIVESINNPGYLPESFNDSKSSSELGLLDKLDLLAAHLQNLDSSNPDLFYKLPATSVGDIGEKLAAIEERGGEESGNLTSSAENFSRSKKSILELEAQIEDRDRLIERLRKNFEAEIGRWETKFEDLRNMYGLCLQDLEATEKELINARKAKKRLGKELEQLKSLKKSSKGEKEHAPFFESRDSRGSSRDDIIVITEDPGGESQVEITDFSTDPKKVIKLRPVENPENPKKTTNESSEVNKEYTELTRLYKEALEEIKRLEIELGEAWKKISKFERQRRGDSPNQMRFIRSEKQLERVKRMREIEGREIQILKDRVFELETANELLEEDLRKPRVNAEDLYHILGELEGVESNFKLKYEICENGKNGENRGLLKEFEKLGLRMAEMKARNKALRLQVEEFDLKKSEIFELKNRINLLKKDIKGANGVNRDLRSEIKAQNRRIRDFEYKAKKLKSTIQNLKKQRERGKGVETELKSEIKNLSKTIKMLKKQNKILTDSSILSKSNTSQKSSRSPARSKSPQKAQNRSVDAILSPEIYPENLSKTDLEKLKSTHPDLLLHTIEAERQQTSHIKSKFQRLLTQSRKQLIFEQEEKERLEALQTDLEQELERAYTQIVAYELKLEELISDLKSTRLTKNSQQRFQTENANLKSQLAHSQQQIKELKTKIQSLLDQIDAEKESILNKSKSLIFDSTHDFKDLAEHLETVTKQLAEAEGRLKREQRGHKETQQELKHTLEQCQDMTKKCFNSIKEIDELKGRLARMKEKDLGRVKEERERFEERVRILEEKVEFLEDEKNELERELREERGRRRDGGEHEYEYVSQSWNERIEILDENERKSKKPKIEKFVKNQASQTELRTEKRLIKSRRVSGEQHTASNIFKTDFVPENSPNSKSVTYSSSTKIRVIKRQMGLLPLHLPTVLVHSPSKGRVLRIPSSPTLVYAEVPGVIPVQIEGINLSERASRRSPNANHQSRRSYQLENCSRTSQNQSSVLSRSATKLTRKTINGSSKEVTRARVKVGDPQTSVNTPKRLISQQPNIKRLTSSNPSKKVAFIKDLSPPISPYQNKPKRAVREPKIDKKVEKGKKVVIEGNLDSGRNLEQERRRRQYQQLIRNKSSQFESQKMHIEAKNRKNLKHQKIVKTDQKKPDPVDSSTHGGYRSARSTFLLDSSPQNLQNIENLGKYGESTPEPQGPNQTRKSTNKDENTPQRLSPELIKKIESENSFKNLVLGRPSQFNNNRHPTPQMWIEGASEHVEDSRKNNSRVDGAGRPENLELSFDEDINTLLAQQANQPSTPTISGLKHHQEARLPALEALGTLGHHFEGRNQSNPNRPIFDDFEGLRDKYLQNRALKGRNDHRNAQNQPRKSGNGYKPTKAEYLNKDQIESSSDDGDEICNIRELSRRSASRGSRTHHKNTSLDRSGLGENSISIQGFMGDSGDSKRVYKDVMPQQSCPDVGGSWGLENLDFFKKLENEENLNLEENVAVADPSGGANRGVLNRVGLNQTHIRQNSSSFEGNPKIEKSSKNGKNLGVKSIPRVSVRLTPPKRTPGAIRIDGFGSEDRKNLENQKKPKIEILSRRSPHTGRPQHTRVSLDSREGSLNRTPLSYHPITLRGNNPSTSTLRTNITPQRPVNTMNGLGGPQGGHILPQNGQISNKNFNSKSVILGQTHANQAQFARPRVKGTPNSPIRTEILLENQKIPKISNPTRLVNNASLGIIRDPGALHAAEIATPWPEEASLGSMSSLKHKKYLNPLLVKKPIPGVEPIIPVTSRPLARPHSSAVSILGLNNLKTAFRRSLSPIHASGAVGPVRKILGPEKSPSPVRMAQVYGQNRQNSSVFSREVKIPRKSQQKKFRDSVKNLPQGSSRSIKQASRGHKEYLFNTRLGCGGQELPKNAKIQKPQISQKPLKNQQEKANNASRGTRGTAFTPIPGFNLLSRKGRRSVTKKANISKNRPPGRTSPVKYSSIDSRASSRDKLTPKTREKRLRIAVPGPQPQLASTGQREGILPGNRAPLPSQTLSPVGVNATPKINGSGEILGKKSTEIYQTDLGGLGPMNVIPGAMGTGSGCRKPIEWTSSGLGRQKTDWLDGFHKNGKFSIKPNSVKHGDFRGDGGVHGGHLHRIEYENASGVVRRDQNVSKTPKRQKSAYRQDDAHRARNRHNGGLSGAQEGYPGSEARSRRQEVQESLRSSKHPIHSKTLTNPQTNISLEYSEYTAVVSSRKPPLNRSIQSEINFSKNSSILENLPKNGMISSQSRLGRLKDQLSSSCLRPRHDCELKIAERVTLSRSKNKRVRGQNQHDGRLGASKNLGFDAGGASEVSKSARTKILDYGILGQKSKLDRRERREDRSRGAYRRSGHAINPSEEYGNLKNDKKRLSRIRGSRAQRSQRSGSSASRGSSRYLPSQGIGSSRVSCDENRVISKTEKKGGRGKNPGERGKKHAKTSSKASIYVENEDERGSRAGKSPYRSRASDHDYQGKGHFNLSKHI